MKNLFIAAGLFFASASFALAQTTTTTTTNQERKLSDTVSGMPYSSTSQTAQSDQTVVTDQQPTKEKTVIVTKHAPGTKRDVVKTKKTTTHRASSTY